MKSKAVITIAVMFCVAFTAGVLRVASQDGKERREGVGMDTIQATLGASFSYQGYLQDNNEAANGAYDFEFALYDAIQSGQKIGSTIAVNDLMVADGKFTVNLDFGVDAFPGDRRYLEIQVRPGASSGSFEVLDPRQEILAVPYALGLPGLFSDGNNIGINTTNPAATLDVQGNVWMAAPSYDTNVQLDMVSRDQSSGDKNYVRIMSDPDNQVMSIGVGENGAELANPGFVLTRQNSEGPASRVGINTTIPGATLDVRGNVLVAAPAYDTSMRLDILSRDGTSGDKNYVRIMSDPDSQVMSIGVGENGAELANPGFILTRQNSQGTGSRVGINTTNPQTTLDVAGTANVDVLQIDGGAEISEGFDVNASAGVDPKPSMVVCIDPDNPGDLVVCENSYDRTVAGAVSGAGGVNPGLVMGQDGSIAAGEYPIALTGRVYVLVDAGYGAIQPGDLLTTSDTPGHAMKVQDYDRANGAILGKAMTSLGNGTDLVLVLITLQ